MVELLIVVLVVLIALALIFYVGRLLGIPDVVLVIVCLVILLVVLAGTGAVPNIH